MNLLLDTNALLWWLGEPERIRSEVRRAIADARNAVYVSAASAWEIAIKAALGRLSVPPDARTWLPEALRANRFTPLLIGMEHALGVEHLPRHHADPFDRLLLAQALAEGLTIVTGDPQLEPYGIPLLRC
ncbi:MAG: type II toxin-antitoxin system VapC family toxin [Chloroflexi bacterium]|nr:type II toxin-antitoxin system VapC family toxin [Chloroflexota bacterium]MBI4507426.1 type II toxin-antitoxin system VapC family toxin [Chloroflexota bacterium]